MNQPPVPCSGPFFMPAEQGQRFCIFHAPDDGTSCCGAIVYIHPFGEEMNKSRRMAAVQSRALAGIGYAVLQIDLFGCGDSSGESGQADWQIWQEDVALAIRWLNQRVAAPVCLWGLRLGALLALDVARNSVSAIEKIVLCQPVLNGENFLTQILRLRLAGEMLGAGKNSGTAALRQTLASGEIIEVAGYDISPALAAALDGLDAADIVVRNSAVHWIEITPDADRAMPPAREKIACAWMQQGVPLQRHLVAGAPFWATQEITECAALLPVMEAIFAQAAA